MEQFPKWDYGNTRNFSAFIRFNNYMGKRSDSVLQVGGCMEFGDENYDIDPVIVLLSRLMKSGR